MVLSGYASKLYQPASIFASTSLSDAVCSAFSGAVVINVKLSSFMIVLKTISAVQYQCQIIVFVLVLVFFGSLLFIKNNQVLNVRRAWEKVVAAVVDYSVVLLE